VENLLESLLKWSW